MEVRSSRRMRTLVTQMAHRGLSANEIARALISMMARSATLQSKAGYIDARPLTANSTKFSCDARPDHTLGHSRAAFTGRARTISRRLGLECHRLFSEGVVALVLFRRKLFDNDKFHRLSRCGSDFGNLTKNSCYAVCVIGLDDFFSRTPNQAT